MHFFLPRFWRTRRLAPVRLAGWRLRGEDDQGAETTLKFSRRQAINPYVRWSLAPYLMVHFSLCFTGEHRLRFFSICGASRPLSIVLFWRARRLPPCGSRGGGCAGRMIRERRQHSSSPGGSPSILMCVGTFLALLCDGAFLSLSCWRKSPSRSLFLSMCVHRGLPLVLFWRTRRLPPCGSRNGGCAGRMISAEATLKFSRRHTIDSSCV